MQERRQRKQQRSNNMGCSQSKATPSTVVKTDTVVKPSPESTPPPSSTPATEPASEPVTEPATESRSTTPVERLEEGAPILLPGQPHFHPSFNGRNGVQFGYLYQRTEEQLDGGNFGAIFQCRHLQGSDGDYWKVGAVKITQPNALDTLGGPIRSYDELEQRCQEIRTLMLLQRAPASPRILRLQEYFYDRGTKELKVVTELLQMNLKDWIDEQQQFTETQARTVARMLVGAMKFMHARNILHRDIKEANVVFQKTGDLNTLKLVDFGLAKDLRPGEMEHAFCGSMGYIAPEIYMREPYSFKVDLFSFGVLMFKILSGKRPWPAGPQEVTARKTVNLEYRIINEHWHGVSSLGRDFIRNLLVFDEERMDAVEAEHHEWLHEDTVTVLRADVLEKGGHESPSVAVINPEGASQAAHSRDSPKFWVEDDVVDAIQTFIPLGAFRGAIIDNPTDQGGLYLVEELLPENSKKLPFFIMDSQVYTERECRNVCRAIAERIQLFHNENIVHRKLHMENVVVEGRPGSADFNVSLRGVQYCQLIREGVPLTGRVGRKMRGFQAFIGPEILSDFYHDKRVDLWSLGAIIYMCLCGTAPDKPENYFSMFRPSDMAADLVLRLLRVNPAHRLSIEEVLQHPWMNAPDRQLKGHGLDLSKILFEDYHRSVRR